MRIPIDDIMIDLGHREPSTQKVKEMAESISMVGLLTPILVDRDHRLIAGLCRLKAAQQLGWAEIDCRVTGLSGARAELAAIEENYTRRDLSPLEYGEMVLRRQQLYSILR